MAELENIRSRIRSLTGDDFVSSLTSICSDLQREHNIVEDFSSCSAKNRYISAGLPHLPFPEGMFSVVLSGHFLFLYGDRLKLDFHKACLVELLRVCSGKVRIFPLVGLDTKPYSRLDEILQFLAEKDIRADIVKVPLEFQRGADHMVRLSRNVISKEVSHGN